MNDRDELARRIVRELDRSLSDIGPAQRERLRRARETALARFGRQPEARVPAWVPVIAGSRDGHSVLGVRSLLPIAALVLGLIGIVYVHSRGPSSDIADIDAGLLTDELPINAYLDKGFDAWLRPSSR